MAANNFATMLHRNTNKLTLILIYAVLEWILIVLLLLNSLFSYLILKFSDYFGLKRPCLWCSRLDHIFEPQKKKNFYRDLVCDNHATEISKLGFCSNHQKLAESQDMCEDCSSSMQSNGQNMSNLAFFRWVEDIGMIQNDGCDKRIENGEMNLNCSCCDVSLNSKFYSPYVYIKPSWGVLDYTQKGSLMKEAGEVDNLDRNRSDYTDEEKIDEKREGGGDEVIKNQMLSDVDDELVGFKEVGIYEDDKKEEEEEEEEEENLKEDYLIELMKDPSSDEPIIQFRSPEDASLEILLQSLEIQADDHRLISIEMMDSSTPIEGHKEAKFGSELNLELEESKFKREKEEESKFELIESMELEENEDYLIFHATKGDLIMDVQEQVFVTEETQTVSYVVGNHVQETAAAAAGETDSNVHSGTPQTVSYVVGNDVQETEAAATAGETDSNVHSGTPQTVSYVVGNDVQETEAAATAGETDSNVHSGTPQTVSYVVGNDVQETEAVATAGETDSNVHPESEEVIQLETNETKVEILIETEMADPVQINLIENREIPAHFPANDDHGTDNQPEEEQVERKTISVEINERADKKFLFCSETNESEEEKVPGTPTSIEGLNNLHKNFEKREWASGTEESLDGSVISEFEYGDAGSTVEKLKSALKSERKTLNVLYAELEEERSASAVAANQTMAMINRLQEEKAAMQMEAFQYQRMMEEQSEYDQEALQLLNELMVKREKEKQELERELEVYRIKVMEFEAKEKMTVLKRLREGSIRSGMSSASCSNAEDSDGQSIDMNHEESFHGGQENGNHNTPVDEVINLDESLAHFEEERLSILEQLKVLEEKLFTLDDEEEMKFTDVKPIEDFYQENNGQHFDDNSMENEFSMELNGKHHQERRIMIPKAKRLLPLFDAETEDENGFDSGVSQNSSGSKSEADSNRLAIEEEVDHVYERLLALEADREFLRHCFSSLKKGDKGIDLLQEILLHLRDLRNVELRVKNMGDGLLQ